MRRDAREARLSEGSILWTKYKKIIIFYQICPQVTSCFYLTLSIPFWRCSFCPTIVLKRHQRENITTAATQTHYILHFFTIWLCSCKCLAGWKRADSPQWEWLCPSRALAQALSCCARQFSSKHPGQGPRSKLWWKCTVESECCSHPGTEIWVMLGCPLSHPGTRAQTLMRLAGQPGAHWW